MNDHSDHVDIDVWRFSLDWTREDIESQLDHLTSEEKKFIHRGIAPVIGERSALSRLGLRKILSTYLDIEPHKIPLSIGEHGKPFLDSGSLQFNLSHCRDRAILVASTDTELGVDLEKVREESPIEDLSTRCFSEKEQKLWKAVPEQQRRISFFHLWVQKEALVKAHGNGMTIPLRKFEGVPDPQVLTGTIRSELPEIGNENWNFQAFEESQQMRSAVMYRARHAKITQKDVEPVGLSRW